MYLALFQIIPKKHAALHRKLESLHLSDVRERVAGSLSTICVRIKIDDGLRWNRRNLWSQIRFAGCLMTGVTLYERLFVSCGKQRTVLLVDGHLQLLHHAIVNTVI